MRVPVGRNRTSKVHLVSIIRLLLIGQELYTFIYPSLIRSFIHSVQSKLLPYARDYSVIFKLLFFFNPVLNPGFYSLYSICACAQSCPTRCDPMDCSQPGSSAHGIFQARVLEWVAISSSRVCSRPKDQTRVSYIGRRILYPLSCGRTPPFYLATNNSKLFCHTHCLPPSFLKLIN